MFNREKNTCGCSNDYLEKNNSGDILVLKCLNCSYESKWKECPACSRKSMLIISKGNGECINCNYDNIPRS